MMKTTITPDKPRRKKIPRIKSLRTISDDIRGILTIVTIENIFFWIGLLAKLTVTGELFINPASLFQLDLGLLFMVMLYITAMNDPFMWIFLVLGWIFGGIYARQEFDARATNVFMGAVLFLPLLLVVIFSLLIIPLFPFLVIIIPILFILIIPFALFAMFGFGFTRFFTGDKSEFKITPKITSSPHFLVLRVKPQGEPVRYCPFRSINEPGCSFLGYRTVNAPLVCDYTSTYTQCDIYYHLWQNVHKEGGKN